MTVSIIIPVYNTEKYIRKCLESVISQQCDGFSIECILVDDCTPDGSMAIAEQVIGNYEGHDVRFVVLHHQQNRGLSVARNTGINASTGEYLCFLDSDDCLLEKTIQMLLSHALAHPQVDLIMGSSLCVGVNSTTNEAITQGSLGPVLLNDKHKIWEFFLRRQLDHHPWNKLLKRPVGDNQYLLFDAGVIYEDIYWMYRIVSHVSSILVSPRLTYIYEYNPKSIIHTIAKRSTNLIQSLAFTCKQILENPPTVNGKRVHFTAHRLFILHWMLFTIDARDKYGIDKQTDDTIETIKRQLLWGAVKRGRVLLSAYLLILFFPFNRLLRFRLVRSNVDRINKIVYRLSWK